MRLQEHHCISPQRTVPPGGTDDDPLDDGVRNAWFPTVDLFQSGVRPIFIASPDLISHLHLQDRVTISYRDGDEAERTVYETFKEGTPNSHNEDTCGTCQHRRRDEQSSMDGVETLPRHSDYEDDFAEAGLGQSSYGDDEEDTYDTSCTGIRDIIFTGSVRHFFVCCLLPQLIGVFFGRPILITAWLGGGLRSLAVCVHGMAYLRLSVSRYVVLVSSVEGPVRVSNLAFRSLTQPDGDDRSGSSGATSTMEKCLLAAGVV